MLHRDTPSHPMVFEIVFEVIGDIDKAAVRESLDFLVERHPLSTAVISDGHWRADPERQIPVHWGESPLSKLDLRVQGGIRLVITSGRIRFEFHHATTDAEGASLFVRDFAQAYQERTGGPSRRWSRHNTQGLLERHVIPWPKKPEGHDGNEPISLWRRLQLALQIVARLPEQLLGDQWLPSAPTRPMRSLTFSPAETQQVAQRAVDMKVNLASVSFSLLFRTLARWQARCGVSPGLRRIRVLVPTSIRQLSDYRMGACNRNSFAFLTRTRQSALECNTEFIESMHQEMRFIREARPDLSTLLGLELAQRFNLLSLVGRLPTLQSTAALTYLGDFSNSRQHAADEAGVKVGNLIVTRVAGSPPISSGTRFAFAVNRAGERMSVGLRSDAQTFSPEAEKALLESYAQCWAEWAGFALKI